MGRKQNQQQESKKFLGQNSTRKTKKKYKIIFPKIIFIGRSPLPLYNVGGLGTDVSKNPLRWRGACAERPVTEVGAPTCFFAFFF